MEAVSFSLASPPLWEMTMPNHEGSECGNSSLQEGRGTLKSIADIQNASSVNLMRNPSHTTSKAHLCALEIRQAVYEAISHWLSVSSSQELVS